ncbi:MAG: diguanylate cyclase [Spirochaetales bacterium]|nr:diguanylate cyclase [Spirochaetales bacterium]
MPSKPKVLIVDDRVENLVTLEALLEDFDVECIRAESGSEALAHTLDHHFAVALLDVMMPDMDGFELTRLLRGSKKTRNVPILFVTAAIRDLEQQSEGYEAGGSGYLLKPINPLVFRSKVSIFLELHRQREELVEKTTELDRRLNELQALQVQLERTNRELTSLSTLDPLTGLGNRRRFDAILEEEWKRSIRHRIPLSLLIIDIDHFKLFNDNYGHLRGDECLRSVAQALTSSLKRFVDSVARFGGEEFIAVLPDTGREGALEVAERIRTTVIEQHIPHEYSPVSSVLTVSIGHATLVPQKGSDPLSLVESADRALYRAKKEGRNRSCAADAECSLLKTV